LVNAKAKANLINDSNYVNIINANIQCCIDLKLLVWFIIQIYYQHGPCIIFEVKDTRTWSLFLFLSVNNTY